MTRRGGMISQREKKGLGRRETAGDGATGRSVRAFLLGTTD